MQLLMQAQPTYGSCQGIQMPLCRAAGLCAAQLGPQRMRGQSTACYASARRNSRTSRPSSSPTRNQAAVAAPPAQQVQNTPIPAAAAQGDSILDTLSEEQRRVVHAKEDVVLVDAGPGSGKTRTIQAAAVHNVQSGVPASSMVLIAFTKQAARELEERSAGIQGITIGTFHRLACRLLRTYGPEVGLARDELTIVGRVVKAGLIGSVLDAKHGSDSAQATLAKMCGSTKSQRARKVSAAELRQSNITYMTKHISKIKNFSASIVSPSETMWPGGRRFGWELVEELRNAGVAPFGGGQEPLSEESRRIVAKIYDDYHDMLATRPGRFDLDDLLHYGLALLRDNPTVLNKVHRRWKHVFVDEVQDLNLCQLEFIKQLSSGPSTRLRMVGDDDQAIYGFRGGVDNMMDKAYLEEWVDEMRPGATRAIYKLSDNYRSGPNLTAFFDTISQAEVDPAVCKGGQYMASATHSGQKTTSKRTDSDGTVVCCPAATEGNEVQICIDAVQRFLDMGHAHKDIAVLCRTNSAQLKAAYEEAIIRRIPARLQRGGFWQAIEIQTALALLRAVVNPEMAGEELRDRVIDKSSASSAGLRIPLTNKLGTTPFDQLNLFKSGKPQPLGSVLLSGCGLGSLTTDEADAVWQQWEDAKSQLTADAEADVMQRVDALIGLAPEYQHPGSKPLSKSQQAGIDRLRGLVQLATAAAVRGDSPVQARRERASVQDILELLLVESGILPCLEEDAQAQCTSTEEEEQRGVLKNRLDYLYMLLGMADRLDKSFASRQAAADLWDDGFGDLQQGQPSYRSASSDTANHLQPLRQFMSDCELEYEDESDDEDDGHVSFLSMHAAKGREYACVVLIDVRATVVPHFRAETLEDFKQERNIFYVAATRAKEHLLIMWPEVVQRNGNPIRTRPTNLLHPKYYVSLHST